MKYNGFYFWLFKGTMKKVLAEQYGPRRAAELMKQSARTYRELVENADDIGDDNPMAFNETITLVFVASYLAGGKEIPVEVVREMIRRSLDHVRFFFRGIDLNTEKGKAASLKSIRRYVEWYTPEREAKYPTSFKVDFVGRPSEGACYYRITRCPICIYMKRLGAEELTPLFCELDHVMTAMQHGVLHRSQTIAGGGDFCDYYLTGDRE